MCGIAGASWTANSPPLDLAVLERMTTVLSHRGPDDAGYFHSTWAASGMTAAAMSSRSAEASGSGSAAPGAALGHRRLSIIDLSTGHQPLSNEDGSVWIAFNGEIYNYRELIPELESRGHRFRTASDTEVIVHLYEEHGPACVERLRGMFAFAIWDDRQKVLFLARDRLGKKPLFYRREPDRVLFGSELKALLEVPGIAREIDPQAVDEYLTYQYVPHPHCILRGFSKLPPAHWATFRDGVFEVRKYWTPPFEEEVDGGRWMADGYAGAKKRLREVLTEAVRLRLRSDVPLGAFLSGGVDSTIIVGLMQQLSNRPVQTYSIGFPVASFDERSYAREAATHLGTDHHEFVVKPSALDSLPKLIWHYDEPFADSSAIPTMSLCEMTRRNVTVALSGDGGDELFAGYERYRAVQLGQTFDHLPRWCRRLITARLWQKIPTSVDQKSRGRRIKRLLGALAEIPERRYLNWVSMFGESRRRELYHPEFARQLAGANAAEFLLQAYTTCPSRDFVTRTTCVDVLTYLPCDILTKVDIASMAYGLEARSPFLDHEVVELASRLPIEFKLSRGRAKRILIDTFADLLPPSIRRRPKMGFGVPLGQWFRNELRPLLEDVLLDQTSAARGLFDPAVVRRLIDEHQRQQWDHSYRLWCLLVLELWMRKFLVPTQTSLVA
ncbi:MAG: asparagine synthase (glutamine-hydrolyzing) [Planctomycetales bacterium]|nr:asparagine synthase (glutamine-hydrolyzing) [Planctomycetales bacterium]